MSNQNDQVPTTRQGIHLLVADDEPNIRGPLARSLNLLGYAVTEAASGEEALLRLREKRYDLMLLDLLMPGIDGVTVMQEAHRIQPDLLMIILTGNATLESAIAAIQTEAVNYLLKPSSNREIASAIDNALAKRSLHNQRETFIHLVDEALSLFGTLETIPPTETVGASPRFLNLPPLRLDRVRRQVINLQHSGEPARLTRGEMTVLVCLMTRPDQVLSCQDLARLGWDYNIPRQEAENMIRPYISRLRGKIEPDPKKPSLIQTIRGQGYCFVPAQAAKYSD